MVITHSHQFGENGFSPKADNKFSPGTEKHLASRGRWRLCSFPYVVKVSQDSPAYFDKVNSSPYLKNNSSKHVKIYNDIGLQR